MNLIISHKNKNLPRPAELSKKTGHNGLALSFVVHQHEYHRYYDFCIEVKGVLKTWTLPKGPSMKPFDKRLAMMVEDNPLSYKDFEGEIPNILYDSDTVEIWDSGIYTPIDDKGNIVSEDDVEYAIETGNH